MERSNMRKEKHTRQNNSLRLKYIIILCITILQGYTVLSAQDVLPVKARRDHNSGPVYSSAAMEKLMKFISVSSSMPSYFKDTTENVIIDPTGSLDSFWEKLSNMESPVRIVHIGDSHVRGHVFPYVMRKLLEEDFGHEAVIDYSVNYNTTGLAQETGKAGVVYHILGVNGATCESFNKPERITEITSLNPDLVIMSFGTNEAHGRNYRSAEHRIQMMNLIKELKKGCINSEFLITTPPGAYVRSGRRNRILQINFVFSAPVIENGKLPVCNRWCPDSEPDRISACSPDLILIRCKFCIINISASCLRIIMLGSIFGRTFLDLDKFFGFRSRFPCKNVFLKENPNRFGTGYEQIFRFFL